MAGCCLSLCCHAAPAQWETRCDKPQDQIELKPGTNGICFVVTSPTGIGQGEIILKEGDWPSEVRIQLKLRSMEMLKIEHDLLLLEIAMRSQSGHQPVAAILKKRSPILRRDKLDANSPYHPKVRALDAHGREVNGLPPEGGSFVVSLPRAFLADDVRSVRLSWIDFWR